MALNQLQRILFLQGQCCFFCNRTIPKNEASVEHLVPVSAKGPNHPDNLVVCCKSLNGLFGNMSLKEKMRVILKQHGKFTCPNQPEPPPKQSPANRTAKTKEAPYAVT